MPTSFAARFPEKVLRFAPFAVLTGTAIALSVGAFLYQKAITPFSSRGVASLRTSASCAVPTPASTTNEHKQLFVSCAGFLN